MVTHKQALETEVVPCNLCGNTQRKALFAENYTLHGTTVQLKLGKCSECGLVSVSPRLTPESVRLVYEFDGEDTISSRYCWEETADTKRFRPLLERVRQVVPSGKFLDVGCGAGDLLNAAKQMGCWELEGLDPSRQAAETARKRIDCPIHEATLEDVDLPEASFDVIAMLGVLEHLHDPVGTLERVHRLLKPAGAVIIYVPNFDYLRIKDAGPLCYLRRGRWSDLHLQEHMFQFTCGSLQKVLNQTGFDVARIDIGQPFLTGGRVAKTIKHVAYTGAVAMKTMTGLHLGGLEAIARRAA